MKDVNVKANTLIPQVTESSVKHTNLKSIQRTLRRMKHTVKRSDGQSLDLSVTFQEFYSVVQKMYKDGDSMTKQLITEFLNLGFKEILI